MTTTDTKHSKTIVLIHGLWLNALSWENWIERYRQRGYEVIAKSWPGMDGDLARLRADHAAVDNLGLGEVIDHYESIVRELPERPIIMGHSMGGVVAQVLLGRGYGTAGVAIDPGPIKGVLNLPLSALRSALACPQEPGQQPSRGDALGRGVSLRLHEHAHDRRVGAHVRAVRRPGSGPRPVPGSARQLQPVGGDARRPPQRRARAAAADRGRRRSHRAARP